MGTEMGNKVSLCWKGIEKQVLDWFPGKEVVSRTLTIETDQKLS